METSATTTTPSNSETSSAPLDAPREGSRLDRLKALLNDEAGESPDTGEAGESQPNAQPKAGKPKGKPKVLHDLAERLELAPEDLYAVEIPMSDGKTLSIGKLKDAAAKESDLTVRELAFEERISNTEAEWARGQRELQALMAAVDPKAIKPEVREQVRLHVAAETKRERELTLKHIPQWQNETVRDAELAGMVELLKDYGIGEQFLSANPNHKVFRFVRDAFLRKQRITAALAKVVEVKKPSTTGRSAAGNGAARAPAVETKSKVHGSLRSRVLGVLK